MKTISELRKEIAELETDEDKEETIDKWIDFFDSLKDKPKQDMNDLQKTIYIALLKATLIQTESFVEMINKLYPKYCPFCSAIYGTCNCVEDRALRYLISNLNQLKVEIEGETK